jgi:hypothetical protein
MADVSVSLDSSDIPVILHALRALRGLLIEHEGQPAPRPTLQEIDLLINTFESVPT